MLCKRVEFLFPYGWRVLLPVHGLPTEYGVDGRQTRDRRMDALQPRQEDSRPPLTRSVRPRRGSQGQIARAFTSYASQLLRVTVQPGRAAHVLRYHLQQFACQLGTQSSSASGTASSHFPLASQSLASFTGLLDLQAAFQLSSTNIMLLSTSSNPLTV